MKQLLIPLGKHFIKIVLMENVFFHTLNPSLI